MAFEVTRIKRLDVNHIHIYYDVWHPNCKPCSLRKKIALFQTKEKITSEQAREIIEQGLHLRVRGV